MAKVKKKCCGSCTHWVKTHGIKGLCDKMDLGWVGSDHGTHCKEWGSMRDDSPRIKLDLFEHREEANG